MTEAWHGSIPSFGKQLIRGRHMALHLHSFLPLAGIFPNGSSSVGRQRLVHMVAEQQARPAATSHELYPQELPSDADSLKDRQT
jgi:hypothetical protein